MMRNKANEKEINRDKQKKWAKKMINNVGG